VMMCGSCTKITGAMVFVAGLAFLMFGIGSLDGKTTHQLAGVLLSIVGLGFIFHGAGMCPVCNAEMKSMKGK